MHINFNRCVHYCCFNYNVYYCPKDKSSADTDASLTETLFCVAVHHCGLYWRYHVIWEHHISFLMQHSLQYSGRELHYCRQIVRAGQETQCPLSIHPLSQHNPTLLRATQAPSTLTTTTGPNEFRPHQLCAEF